MENLNIRTVIEKINNDIKLNKQRKLKNVNIMVSLISILSLFLLLMINFSFFNFLILPIFVINCITIPCIVVLQNKIDFLSSKNDYRRYIINYTVLKGKKEHIYKIETKKGEIFFANKEGIVGTYGDQKVLIESLNEKIKKLEEDAETDSFSRAPNDKEDIKPIVYQRISDKPEKFNQAIGREKELELLEESLLMDSICPIIIGPSGVGKTALVHGLIYKLQTGQLCDELRNKKINEVYVSDLVAGSKYLGVFEQNMQRFISKAKNKDNIFFIDEFHTIIGAGQSEKSNIDGANILKPYLSNGQIKIIGATTEEEYKEIIKKDSAFDRRFDVIRLSEPEGEVLYNIVAAHVFNYERRYNIKFGNSEIEKKAILEALIESTDKKHRKYNADSNNPSLILSIIERAFVKAKRLRLSVVTVQNVCDAVKCNQNLSSVSIENTIKGMNKLEVKEEMPKQLIKLHNREM